jgi:hypothetical protein
LWCFSARKNPSEYRIAHGKYFEDVQSRDIVATAEMARHEDTNGHAPVKQQMAYFSCFLSFPIIGITPSATMQLLFYSLLLQELV